MSGWILGGTNTPWFGDMFSATPCPRSFSIFVTLSYETENPRSDEH